jgi:O-antigen ligase
MSKKKHRQSAVNTSTQTEVGSGKKNIAVDTKPGGLNSMTNWLILLVILIPVLYSTITMDPNITIRYMYMGGILLGMGVYFYIIRKIPLQIPQSVLLRSVYALGIAFAAWSIISMFSAINYREGYYEVSRHLMNIILLFFVMTAISKEETQIVKLCKVLVMVSLFQSFVGILQYYDLAFTELPGANAKPFGLMSNRNLFGSAQALMLPFVIYLYYKAGKFWKLISAAAIICITISLLLSQTRSAWIAAAAILAVSLILVLIFSAINRKKWIIGFIITMLSITGIVFLVLLTDNEGTLKQSVKERTTGFTQTSEQTTESVANVQERIKIWNKTIRLIKDKPITGAGPGNWKINIAAYGSTGLVWEYGKFGPDRPHNVYLLVASETGIPGAVLYFGMWVLIAIIAFKIIYKPQSEDQRILVILMLSGIAAFACDSMFSFPNERIEHTLYLMLMGGIILGSYKNVSAEENNEKRSINKPLLVLIVSILIFNLFIGYKKYNYEVHLNRAKAYENANNFTEMLREAEEGKSDLITMGPETGITMQLKTSIALKELKEYDRALREINIAKSYNPYNANIWITMGTIYTDLKQFDKAIPCYEKALQINPYYDIALKNLAINYFNVNNYEGCIKSLTKVDIKGDTYLTDLFNEATRRLAEKK